MQDVTSDTSVQQLPAINELHDSGEAVPRSHRSFQQPHAALQQPVPLTLIIKAEACSEQSGAAAVSIHPSTSVSMER